MPYAREEPVQNIGFYIKNVLFSVYDTKYVYTREGERVYLYSLTLYQGLRMR